MTDFILTESEIRRRLDLLAKDCPHVAAAVKLVGYPAERRGTQGFQTFMQVIVGQQLSVKAAATIRGRVEALVGDPANPDSYDKVTDEQLRGAGLSWQKISYARSLVETVRDGTLDVDALPHMSDDDAIAAITAVKGLGVWSAHMYLMFSLGRPDIWPVGDLAVRVGAGRIVGHAERPTEKEALTIGERWKPHRSAIALLAWHYYSNAPAIGD
ncbi:MULTISPECIES: DNA-3-methyladenine glycosylase family protein [Kordiimonas]|jgi:DNA-3-methyladenine glycosylase II|uniref:DNA-3-methyladenine glycosylase family protein n=1 Tax=Kordiimonas TaxID=288021 RepID=UPI00257B90FC|nr:DNA-3-methyladenine glycosylase 2 family protein [Kordiimonas sp. UBA4487]